MGLNTEASAALVYLILYAILFVTLLVGLATGSMKLKSRYSIILFHVVIRMAAQATGLTFGIVGYSHTGLLVAYLTLGAEGYFTLVLCTYRFLISWQYHNSATRDSWIEPRHPAGDRWYKRTIVDLYRQRHPMFVIHQLLIIANAIIITGGSLLTGGGTDISHSKLVSAKAMRTAGQSAFLLINVFLIYCIIDVVKQSHREHPGKGTHPTLTILLIIWPFLFIRGVYGVLSGVLPAFNYLNINNYGSGGLKTSFVISEYIMGTTMEWCSCTLLMLTWYTSRHDPKKLDVQASEDKEERATRIEA